jgi:hypothetical protein
VTEIVQPGDVLIYPIVENCRPGDSEVVRNTLSSVLPGVTVHVVSGARAAVVYRPQETPRPGPDIEAAAERAYRAAGWEGPWNTSGDVNREYWRAIARAVLGVDE